MEIENVEQKVLKVGEKIPELVLDIYDPVKDELQDRVKINDVVKGGKWLILFFYPADYTFVCPTELADLAEKYEVLKEKDVEVISVSTDTHYVHYAWRQSEEILNGVNYPMGADPTHEVSKLFGVYDEATGLALRGTFIINPDSEIVSSEVNFYNVGRNSDELLRKVEAFQFVRNKPSNVCPAKWEPGDEVLEPGKDIIGKIKDSFVKGE